eukprot:2728135-Pleurochrysis_carterae.AAC.1
MDGPVVISHAVVLVKAVVVADVGLDAAGVAAAVVRVIVIINYANAALTRLCLLAGLLCGARLPFGHLFLREPILLTGIISVFE